jgi:hypothetical protein
MRIKEIVPEPCHICGKQTSLAAIEPHPTHPEVELRTFRCDDCGPVRTVSHIAGGNRTERHSNLPLPSRSRSAA